MRIREWSRADLWVLAAYAAAVVFVTITKGLHHPGNFLLFRCVAGRLTAGYPVVSRKSRHVPSSAMSTTAPRSTQEE